ncbi:hypothetical protein [Duncaniella dubosii]
METFQFVGAEGFGWLTDYLYSHGLAMPRPRNVLIRNNDGYACRIQ